MKTTAFSIGVSGHQNLGDEKTKQYIARQFRTLLATYQQGEQQVVLYSALAMGADQLFVQIALEQGVPVDIVLPCAEYETLFSSEAERNEYTRLLRSCRNTYKLPPQTCSDDAFLAAGQWIVNQSDLVILAWDGMVARGRGGTGDVANYARSVGRTFIHIHTRHHTVKTYRGVSSSEKKATVGSPKHDFTIAKKPVYQGAVLTVNQYHVHMPDGTDVVRDVVERPESVLIVPVGEKESVLLIEEYDFGAGVWQLTLPGGKVEQMTSEKIEEQAQQELRQEIGYRAGTLEKLTDFYSHPGYISHRVHVFIAYNLEWDPLEFETHEEIKVHTYLLNDALAETAIATRCDPEAALALWLYAHKKKRTL